MSVIFTTTSLCPVCYKEIPAVIDMDGRNVWMEKECSCWQGRTLVEKNAGLYMTLSCRMRRVFDQHMVFDITERCNLNCSACYFPVHNTAKDEPQQSVIKRILATPYQPVLSGGEPTLRADLPELVAALTAFGRKVSMLTNGIRLADIDYLRALHSAGMRTGNIFEASISIHPESDQPASVYQKKIQVLKNLRQLGMKAFALMFTIHSPEQISEIVPVIRAWSDVALTFRIRGAFNAWNENEAGKPIFISEMLDTLKQHGNWALDDQWDNNLYHATVMFRDTTVRLVSVPNKATVDLSRLRDVGPFHISKDGHTRNLVHSMLVNEGMAAGWLNGERI